MKYLYFVSYTSPRTGRGFGWAVVKRENLITGSSDIQEITATLENTIPELEKGQAVILYFALLSEIAEVKSE